MKQIVERERNKTYYRVLHLPLWIWVFFVLPGHLTYRLFVHGPDWRHWTWLSLVVLVCIWRGSAGRLPGVERAPYITHFGHDQPNLLYRAVCYTAAWIDLTVPFTLNFLGLVVAIFTGRWMLGELYGWLYYPLALLIVLATCFDFTPRARRLTANEGAERAWFYVAVWTVVPSQLAGWAAWRLGARISLPPLELILVRFSVFVIVALLFFFLSFRGKLGRTERYYAGASPQLRNADFGMRNAE
ncbi:MAG TPA: hypothetical protein VGK99_18655 [Acidobacteriota bacterium]|jgi:uncharacterized membrane protein